MKCVLHIGTEKTGTTILQNWLYSNQDALSKHGVFLSNMLEKTNNRLAVAFFQDHLDDWAKQNRIQTIDEKNQYFAGFLDKWSNEIAEARKSHNVFVITSEHFHSRIRHHHEVEAIYEFLSSNFSELEVVCYFRNQFDTAVSLYSTALKNFTYTDLDAFLEQVTEDNFYYNYADIADLWSDTFGTERCNFRLYDRDLFPDGDIRKDLLGIIDSKIRFDDFDSSVSSANTSLTALQAAAYRAINKNAPFWLENNGGKNPLNTKLKQLTNEIDDLFIGKIRNSKRKPILNRFSESNSRFFAKHFESPNLFACDEEEPAQAETYSMQQVENVVENVFGSVLQMKGLSFLRDDQIDFLRDLSLKIGRGYEPQKEDALALMKIAQIHRHKGWLINSKIKEWESEK